MDLIKKCSKNFCRCWCCFPAEIPGNILLSVAVRWFVCIWNAAVEVLCLKHNFCMYILTLLWKVRKVKAKLSTSRLYLSVIAIREAVVLLHFFYLISAMANWQHGTGNSINGQNILMITVSQRNSFLSMKEQVCGKTCLLIGTFMTSVFCEDFLMSRNRESILQHFLSLGA